MQPVDAQTTPAADADVKDLGPLSWVIEELGKSFDSSIKILKRFLLETTNVQSDLSAVDTGQLRIAKQHLHQALGALKLLEMDQLADLVDAMDVAAGRFVLKPALLTQDSVNTFENTSFALIEYLQSLLAGKNVSLLNLFAQYRDVKNLAKLEPIHPANLWVKQSFQWLEPVADSAVSSKLSYSPLLRVEIDEALLQVIKSADEAAAAKLSQLSLGLAQSQNNAKAKTFWKICAAFFEAISKKLIPIDIYVKRTAAGVIVHYNNLQHGDWIFSDKYMQNMLFFCGQAKLERADESSILYIVKKTWGIDDEVNVDYEVSQFGKFDPAILAMAKKRIIVAKELWTSLSGGDVQKIRSTSEQFKLLAASFIKLYPSSQSLAIALVNASDNILAAKEVPRTELAIEVATAILYIENVFGGWGFSETDMELRAKKLAQRIDSVSGGGQAGTIEPWIEALYRSASDKESMGSVVGELRICLADIEKAIDQYFRSPINSQVLQSVPEKLRQMRGIFSVLGLSEAASAVIEMRERVHAFSVVNYDFESAQLDGIFDKFANNLGALGFLIDMLSYQPALVKKLFIFDATNGTLKPFMGRVEQSNSGPVSPIDIPSIAQSGSLNSLQQSPSLQVQSNDSDYISTDIGEIKTELNEESDLKDVFLEEAFEVIKVGVEASRLLLQNPKNLEAQSTLRRAFHTLKGSSRMVGFDDFGEAAWSFEQLVNTRLADQQPFDSYICQLSITSLNSFKLWLNDLRTNTPTSWSSTQFRQSADTLRFENRLDLNGLVNFADGSLSLGSSIQKTIENEISDEELLSSLENFELHELSKVELPSSTVAENEIQSSKEVSPEVVSSEVVIPEKVIPEKVVKLSSFAANEKPIEVIKPNVIDAVHVASVKIVETETPGVGVISAERTVQGVTSILINKNQSEEQFKNIGALKIGIPLYNVYLNEADEWSRCLVTELDEWVLEHPKPLSISTVNFAHSLAGSSATVGFHQLANLSKSLEQALEKMFRQQNGTKADALVFALVAEECRRLLHQFAAGFLEDPKANVVARLAQHAVIIEKNNVNPVEKLSKTLGSVIEASKHTEIKTLHQPVAINHLAMYTKDDDTDLVDTLDADLSHIFDEEAKELLPRLSGSLRNWVANPINLVARSEVLRTLHTLKGSARLAGAMRLGEMSHRMESEIESIGTENLNIEAVEPLIAWLDALQNHFESIDKFPDDLVTALANKDKNNSDSSTSQVSVNTLLVDQHIASLEQSNVSGAKTAVKPPVSSVIKTEKRETRQSVRVRAKLLDRLVNQAGEVIMTRTKIESELGQLRGSLGDLTGNLDRLRQQLRDVEFQAETQMQSRMEQTKGSEKSFDPLEFDRFTRVQELTRMMAESVNDVATVQRSLQRAVDSTEDDLVAQARQTRDLQRDLLRTRMEEFESISDRLYRVVRQAAKDSAKQVRLDIVGGSIEVDRGVLERMTPSFEHLLRNCIAHGLENSEMRRAAGKDATGFIAITLRQDGNDVVIEFSDDGTGLDYERIRQQAIAQKLVLSSDALTDPEIVNLIFSPGLSTAAQVTELAGRGIGLDVVRTEVIALGGRIDVSSERNKGTKFKLVLPLTTAVTQVVMLRAGTLSFGIPSHLVELVRRSPLKDVEKAYENSYWGSVEDNLKFYWAGALLQVSQRSSEPLMKTNPVVILRSAGQRIAIHVDEIFGNKEVVIKNLGPQLSRLPGLAGMAILVSGAVALIYNPVALASAYGSSVKQYSPLIENPNSQNNGVFVPLLNSSEQHTPLVLVVDDSITVRRVTQRMLQREGFRVVLAVDGLQAIEKLNQEIPDVVLSDIEMPRMDGFDLVRNIRADSKLKHLPVVMITSRIAEKHRDLAMELGVNDYLGKPYSEEGLLAVLRQHTAKKLNESEKV